MKMALLLSALLAAGSILSILCFFSQIPHLISLFRSKQLSQVSSRPVLLLHLTHLVWLLYAAKLWDLDWFLANVLQAIVSLMHLTVFHLLQGHQATFLTRYALCVPMVCLTLWKVLPLEVLVVALVPMQVIAEIVDVRNVAVWREKGVLQVQSLLLKTIQNLAWAYFGYLTSNLLIQVAFLLTAAISSGELVAQTLHSPTRKQP